MNDTHLSGPNRSRSAVSLLGALAALAAASCKHDADRVAAFVAATDQLDEARCKCEARPSECSNEDSLASECAQRVVRKHQDEIEGWLECIVRETRATTECVRDTSCAELDDGACDLELDEVCGEPPEGPSKAIEEEIDRLCTEPIDCDDGSVAQGRFCNDNVECRDGSDEAFCGGDDSSGASDSGGGAVALPPPVDVLGSTPFICSDGSAIPVALVCDGSAHCPDDADEERCFPCSDGTVIRIALNCDGVDDCADGSDEIACDRGPMAPMAPPPGETNVQMCVQVTPVIPGISSSCVSCACSVSPNAALACDATCWALIECVLDFCPDALAGSMEQAQCVITNCTDHVSGAGPATTLGTTFRTTCSAVCPPL